MRNLVLALGSVLMAATPALADRPLTEEEKVKLQSAVSVQGCSGGKLEFDDGHYEADDAKMR
jgi:hypothetical protein